MNFKSFFIDNKSRICNYVFIVAFVILVMLFLNEIPSHASGGSKAEFIKSFNTLSSKMKHITSMVLGFTIISGVGVMIYHLTRLGGSGSNPQARAKILQDMATTGLCVGLLGSISFVVQLMMVWVTK